jgi:hypothetical protein
MSFPKSACLLAIASGQNCNASSGASVASKINGTPRPFSAITRMAEALSLTSLAS